MNIDAIPAGRELDALVAEKVMGWIIDPGLPGECAFLYPPEWKKELNAWPSTQGRQQKHSNDLVPHYSTDWADSLKVLAEMRCRGFLWRLEDCGDSFEAEFIIGMEPFYFTSNANTAPLTICRAALKAVEAQ